MQGDTYRFLTCYKLGKQRFHLYRVWLSFPTCNWLFIMLLKILTGRGSQQQTLPGTACWVQKHICQPQEHVGVIHITALCQAGRGKTAATRPALKTSISQDGHKTVTFRNSHKHSACFVVWTSTTATVPWGEVGLKNKSYCLLKILFIKLTSKFCLLGGFKSQTGFKHRLWEIHSAETVSKINMHKPKNQANPI